MRAVDSAPHQEGSLLRLVLPSALVVADPEVAQVQEWGSASAEVGPAWQEQDSSP